MSKRVKTYRTLLEWQRGFIFKLATRHLPLATHRGFSLVELLVAMAIASVLGMAGVALFASSNWTYKVNEDVSEAQQNVRVAMEVLAKDIRTAGFGLEDPPTQLDFGNGGVFTAPITVTNSSTGPDSITILGIGYEAGKLQSGGSNCVNSFAPNTNGASCIHLDDVSSFFSGSGSFYTSRKYINLGGESFIQLAESGHNQGNKLLELSSPATLDRNRAADTQVYIIQAVTYSNATGLTGCSSKNPCLASKDYTMLRGGNGSPTRQVVAESIEDLQFAYGIDVAPTPRDGKVDDTTSNTSPGVATTADGNFTYADFLNDPADDTSIIAVRASVVAKTRNIDMKGGQFRRQCVEDRSTDTTCTNAATDGYRRRLLTRIIKLRNPRAGE